MRRRSPRTLIDHMRIHVRAGNGGPGSASLRHEKYVPRGGPDGGDGGRGGHVFIRANQQRYDLSHLGGRSTWAAGPGKTGSSNNIHGKNGGDLFIEVPLGTVVMEMDTERTIGDMLKDGQELIVATGGSGGMGNARMVTSTNRCPREAKDGDAGEEKEIILRLKLPIDIALIGPANVGRSTLLAALTGAKPRIEAWPFTTTSPVLGAALTRRFEPVVFAELPALVEGAYEDKGLGNNFLAHAERAGLIILVIEGGETGELEIEIIRRELAAYGRGLQAKPYLICPTREPVSDIDEDDQLRGWLANENSKELLEAILDRWNREQAGQAEI